MQERKISHRGTEAQRRGNSTNHGKEAPRITQSARMRDESSANRVRVMQAVLDQCGDTLPNQFVVATEMQIRVRRRG
jgi:hypothetical protein